MPLAYSYVRFSTTEQKKGDSLRRQTELSERYAAANGLILDNSLHLHDLGISAFDRSNIERGALGGFLEAINQGRIAEGSYLLVESLDRLSRDKVLSALAIFLSILEKGITIVTLADNRVYSSASVGTNSFDLMYSIAIMGRAHDESAIKSHRISASWENKRKNSSTKIITKRCPSWMKAKDDRSGFDLIPERCEVILQIIDWCKAGIGQALIAKKLNEASVSGFSAGDIGWVPSYIQKILTSTALYGTFQSHTGSGATLKPRGEPVENYYPALITKQEFLLIQELRFERRSSISRAKKGTIVSNLLSGLVKCGYCGSSMVLLGGSPKWVNDENKEKIKKRSRKYLACDGARKGQGCYAVQWTYSDFEKSFLMFSQSSHLRQLMTDASTDAKQKKKELSTKERHQSNLSAITECEKKLENLLVSIESGEVSKTIISRINKLEQELDRMKLLDAELSDEIAENLIRGKNRKAEFDSMKALIESLDELPEDRLLEVRSALAQHFRQNITRVTLYPAGWRDGYRRAEAMRNTLNEISPENSEFTNKTVDDFLKENGLIEPKRRGDSPKGRYYIDADTDRAFSISAKNGGYRIVLPDFNDPLKVKIKSTPMDDLY